MMKPQNPTTSSRFTLNPILATALGAAVAATQADAALVSLTPAIKASDSNPSQGSSDSQTFSISSTAVLHVRHSYYYSSDSSTISQRGRIVAVFSSINKLAAARGGAGAFTVSAPMFGANYYSIARGTSSSSPKFTTGNAVDGNDNFIPVKFNLGAGDLFGLAQVDYDVTSVSPGSVELLKFWYSDNGSPLKFDNGAVSEVSAIPEVGGMVSTALLLGMAALVRSRRKDPLAGSLAALAAGVGGLMARANGSEEAA